MLLKFHNGTTVDPSKVVYSYITKESAGFYLKICFAEEVWVRVAFESHEEADKATDKLVRATENSKPEINPKKKRVSRKIR